MKMYSDFMIWNKIMELDQRAENQKKVLLDEKTKHRIKTQQTI